MLGQGPRPAPSNTVSTHELVETALVIGFLILSLGIHEAAHAWVAYRCGDDTAKNEGRMTLNPIVHIDPFMTILLPAMLWFGSGGTIMFGGAKPVPVYPNRLRNPLRDMALVAIAGPASNVILAFIFMLVWKASIVLAGFSSNELLPSVLETCVMLNILLTMFNLLPIPPLDGSRVMAYLLPAGLRESYIQLERFGFILVIGAIYFVPPVRPALWRAMTWLWDILFTATGGNW
ncbi:MAG: Zn-dependent protease [Planctomycetota bacterium]|jgi:Zn-dependent protease